MRKALETADSRIIEDEDAMGRWVDNGGQRGTWCVNRSHR